MKNNKDIALSPSELLEQLKTLVADTKTMVAQSVSEHSADALENLRERAAAAQERFEALYEDGRKKVIAGAKSTDVAIRENPYQAIAVALSVGVLAGILISRRCR